MTTSGIRCDVKEKLKELEKHIAFYEKHGSYKARIIELPEENERLYEREKYLEQRRTDIINKFQNEITDTTIPKSKVKEIIDECIPKGKNIITGKEEYQPNTNANSFLTQRILELMEEKKYVGRMDE